MRILIAGFQHETNTFAPSRTGYQDFVHGGAFPAMTRGADILAMRDVNIPIGGFIRAMQGPRIELVPILWAGATPAAHVEQDAFERIAGEILAAARDGSFDAIYLDLHGAMVCSHDDDGEGLLLAQLRAIVGPRVPIVASLDLHANVTKQMLEQADALVAYRTYPHEDMAEAGERAAGLLKCLLANGSRLHRARGGCPFSFPSTPCAPWSNRRKALIGPWAWPNAGQNVALSFAPGFPAADFPECGGVVWGYGGDARIETAVEGLTRYIVGREGEWVVPFLAPEEAVRRAQWIAAQASRPVVIADTQDNPGGGGDSNTTGMLRALLACNAEEAAMGLMVDPQAARAAHAAGAGHDITIGLGGQSGIAGRCAAFMPPSGWSNCRMGAAAMTAR